MEPQSIEDGEASNCPRCDSDNTEIDPDVDIPGAAPDFGCHDCLYIWDEVAA